MEYFVPLLMCAAFLIFWIFLCKFLLRLYASSVIRSLERAPSLNRKSVAALLSVYFGAKSLYLDRWFPARSKTGTVYREIPFVLVLGRKIFVPEICPYPGVISNTSGADWHIDPPKEFRREKEIWVPNPVWSAEERAQTLKDLFGILRLPFEVTVEPMAVLTDQRHQLLSSVNDGLYELSDAVSHLRSFDTKDKASRKRMKKERELVLAVLKHYSLSKGRAIARNDRMRRNMK